MEKREDLGTHFPQLRTATNTIKGPHTLSQEGHIHVASNKMALLINKVQGDDSIQGQTNPTCPPPCTNSITKISATKGVVCINWIKGLACPRVHTLTRSYFPSMPATAAEGTHPHKVQVGMPRTQTYKHRHGDYHTCTSTTYMYTGWSQMNCHACALLSYASLHACTCILYM